LVFTILLVLNRVTIVVERKYAVQHWIHYYFATLQTGWDSRLWTHFTDWTHFAVWIGLMIQDTLYRLDRTHDLSPRGDGTACVPWPP